MIIITLEDLKTSEIRTEISHLVGKNVRVKGQIFKQVPIGNNKFKIILSPVNINGIDTNHVVLFLNGKIIPHKEGSTVNFTTRVIRYTKKSSATFSMLKDYTLDFIRYKDYENSMFL